MKIPTWNFQATKGRNNRFDVNGIVGHIKKSGNWGHICLQEISRNIAQKRVRVDVAVITDELDHHSVFMEISK